MSSETFDWIVIASLSLQGENLIGENWGFDTNGFKSAQTILGTSFIVGYRKTTLSVTLELLIAHTILGTLFIVGYQAWALWVTGTCLTVCNQ